MRQHPQLERVCKAPNKYVSILRMYQHAVQAYLRSGPAVAEEGSAGESGDEVAELSNLVKIVLAASRAAEAKFQ